MKNLILFLFCWAAIFESFSNVNNEQTKLEILQTVFIHSEIVEIKGSQVLETKARGKFASIPLEKPHCHLLELQNNIFVLAFNLYLCEEQGVYRKKEENNIHMAWDIEEGSELEIMKHSERFIQVIFFDNSKKKFIGKPGNFPLEGLKWVMKGMGDLAEWWSIASLSAINKDDGSCYIRLNECPECNSIYYFFKFKDDIIHTSGKHQGCFDDFKVEYRSIQCKEIMNCYEWKLGEAEPNYKQHVVLRW